MEKEKLKNNNLILVFVITILLVIVLQVITVVIYTNFKNMSTELLKDVLNLTYVENTGGAFGIGQNDTISFILVSIIVLAIIIHFMISQKDKINKLTAISLSFMISGGISNLVDRITRGVVIDYIDISPILKFPVFNLADSLILVGWVMLIISIIIYWRKASNQKKDIGKNE